MPSEIRQEYYNDNYYRVLTEAQNYLSTHYADLFSKKFMDFQDREQRLKIKGYIAQYVTENNVTVRNVPNRKILTDLLYKDMVGYSCLTDEIADVKNQNEEIDINSWDDCEVIRRDGTREKIPHFCNPDHALDVIERMSHYSGRKIDEATPMVEGNLAGNTRFVAMKAPVISDNAGVSASIRIVRPANFERKFFIENGTIREEQLRLLELALKYGISTLYIGETSSGKTTLLNAVASSLPYFYRIYTIETGSRELDLVKRDKDGHIVNSVVSTMSRPSTDPAQNIDQTDLVEKALRFNPDVVIVGEMRGDESAAAVEVALTDHTVTSSLHAPNAELAHIRISQLYNKKYRIDTNVATQMAAEAFPLVVTLKRLADKRRHLMNITECLTSGLNTRKYHTIYQYHVLSNTADPKTGSVHVKGIESFSPPSDRLIQKMKDSGMLDSELKSLGKMLEEEKQVS